jgi:hypothetical protein
VKCRVPHQQHPLLQANRVTDFVRNVEVQPRDVGDQAIAFSNLLQDFGSNEVAGDVGFTPRRQPRKP